MKRILLFILVMAMLLTVQVVPAFADDTAFPSTLSAEDEKRIMGYKMAEGPYFVTNDKLKEAVDNYHLYLEVAKDYMELNENYNYKEISTEAGKKKYLAGFEKYTPYTGNFLKLEENAKLSYITRNKLIKEAIFLTNDNCIYVDGSGVTTVRGVLYFKVLEMNSDVLESFPEVKEGIEYKADIVLYLSGRPDFTEPTQFKVNGFGYMSAATVATSSTMMYTASTIRFKVLVNGKAKTLESYNIINDNNYFKLRDIAMALNGTKKQFQVSYDDKKNTLNLTTGKAYTPVGNELNPPKKETIKLAKKATTRIFINGKEVKLASYIVDGNNYFELKDFAKALNFKSIWDYGKTTVIIIDTSKGYNQ